MQFEAAVVDHGATMVNMTAPSFSLPGLLAATPPVEMLASTSEPPLDSDVIVKGPACVEEATSRWPDNVCLERAPFPVGEPINNIQGRVAFTLRVSPSAVAEPATEAAGCAATFRTTTFTRGWTVTESVCVRLLEPDCASTGRDTPMTAIASVATMLRNATRQRALLGGESPHFREAHESYFSAYTVS
jgi:hypothetical protein